jgi:hypothetical protein
MKSSRSIPVLAALVLCFAAPEANAAKPVAMQLPDELAKVERIPVKGRQGWKLNEQLQFGATRVTEVERSLTKGSDLGIVFYQGAKRRQAFGFTVAEGDAPAWRGAAATNVHRRSLRGDRDDVEISFKDESGFAAHFAPTDKPQDIWVLEMSEKGERPMAGTLRRNDMVFSVIGTNRLEGLRLPLGDTSGYVIAWGSQVLAAVEVVNKGAVWMAPDVKSEHRAPLFAAISSLLLFEDLRATLPE